MLSCLLAANQPIKWQRLNTFSHVDAEKEGLLELKARARTVKKGDRSDFEHGVHGGWRQAGCRSELVAFFTTSQPSLGFTENVRSPQKKIKKKISRELRLMI